MTSPASTAGLVGTLLGVALLGPALMPGYVLRYDLVFVPGAPINDAALGLDGGVPRAVPTDALVALASSIVPGDVVQAMALLGALVLASSGVGRLLPSRTAAAAAAVVVIWNPWVLERLAIGHWAFLVGYGLVPWAVAAAVRAREGGHHGMLAVVVVASAGAGAFSGLIVLSTALAVLIVPAVHPIDWTVAAKTCALAMIANAPWWVAAVARPGDIPADPSGVDAFAPRPDTPFGLVGSLLTGGGIWNEAAVPGERSMWVPTGVTLALVILAGASAAPLMTRGRLVRSQAGARGLGVVALGGLLLALLSGWAVTRPAMAWVVLELPGGGLLRDTHKWLAPFVVLVALSVGVWAQLLRTWVAAPSVPEWAAVTVALLPAMLMLLLQPSGWWGLNGRLESVAFPQSWTRLRTVIAEAPPGDVVALPWRLYRRFDWNGDRVVLEPLPRFLDRNVLVDDRLPLRDRLVSGEDPRSASVTDRLASGTPLDEALREVGVRIAVVHEGQPGSESTKEALVHLPVLMRSTDIVVVDLGPPTPKGRVGPPASTMLVAWAALIVGVGIAVAMARRDLRATSAP
jgi:hypothetical protein